MDFDSLILGSHWIYATIQSVILVITVIVLGKFVFMQANSQLDAEPFWPFGNSMI